MIGKLHVDDSKKTSLLQSIQKKLNFKEIAYLNTCNRVEFFVNCSDYICPGRLKELLSFFCYRDEDLDQFINSAVIYEGSDAVHHLLSVASSLESMVLGEREILAQVKKSFEFAKEAGTNGHVLNLVSKTTVHIAKKVFSTTKIATRPVSVVSLAWMEFQKKGISLNAPILLIGAGQTNSNFARFLKKAGYSNVSVANRTLSKAETICSSEEGWTAHELGNKSGWVKPYQAVVTCTGSDLPLISQDLFDQLASEDFKILIDIALPADTEEEVQKGLASKYVGMKHLQSIADSNMAFRAIELEACEAILSEGLLQINQQFKERELELAMKEIPKIIKEIKSTAMGEVFKNDLDELDDTSKEVLEKILQYMEKKYISVPMKMAREVLLSQATKN
ncbi:MAG: glutamyl-tRNA reductase [Flavobacteriales bacterium]|nr:glutamyl-tRNA reductase [Flavobacteriales bacterium]